MIKQGRNSTRAGRNIENLDDRENPAPTDPGAGTHHGRRMPQYRDEIMEEETNAALDHVQVSAIADIGEDGKVDIDESKIRTKADKKRR